MRFSASLIAAVAAPALVSALPLGKRDPSDSEVLVYQFAGVLEALETQFYQQALAKFQESDFTAAGFASSTVPVEQFQVIGGDEASHLKIINSVLTSFGKTPVSDSCKFNFDSVLTDVNTMATVGRVVENLGVSAYLGGATLLKDPLLLTAAASIATVEARHQTVLNVLNGGSMAIPQAFDIPFTPSEVLSIASPFISGCDLGVPANPALAITNTGAVTEGTTLTFKADGLNDTTAAKAHCQMLTGGSPFSISLPVGQCTVPAGVTGPVAIFVTADDQPLAGNVQDRSTNNGKLIAGPVVAFIDPSAPQGLTSFAKTSNLAAKVAGAPAPAAGETTTLSPASASAVLSAATATGAGAASTAVAKPATPAASNAQTMNEFKGDSKSGMVTVDGWSSMSKADMEKMMAGAA